jgi:hypothetical protein
LPRVFETPNRASDSASETAKDEQQKTPGSGGHRRF